LLKENAMLDEQQAQSRDENTLDPNYVAGALRIEARHLRDVLLGNPAIRWMIEGGTRPPELGEARDAYARLLQMSAEYVRFTVPALRAASEVLSTSADSDDLAWSTRLASYVLDETYDVGQGHESWALADLADLGVSCEGTIHPAAAEYGWYFVDQARSHPYAILGAKSVLEELSVRVANVILSGARNVGAVPASGEEGARFMHHHGDLDVEHGRQGARDLRSLRFAHQRRQVLEGAYITTGVYRQLAHHYLS
jgi:Iron-containing redox enzyme